jgi:hypothetical protein
MRRCAHPSREAAPSERHSISDPTVLHSLQNLQESLETIDAVITLGPLLPEEAALAGGELLMALGEGSSLIRVGERLTSLHDVLANPKLLKGLKPAQLRMLIGRIPAGWRVETLGRGSHKGLGYVLREYLPNGEASGRLIRWHPGGARHGPHPYWKVSKPNAESVRVPGGH